ncbi:MAG: DUF2569 domain-containing protein, partial [Pseudolabrys sp.]|nr:DUF2569 domain-containing protein [Pseudolabrys sp.]
MTSPELLAEEVRGAPLAKAKPPLGGWLILPSIGTFLCPFAYAYGTFDVLKTYSASAPSANEGFALTIALISAVFALGWAWALYLLFKRDRRFPPIFIALAVGVGVFAVGSYWALSAQFNYSLTSEDRRELVQVVLFALIWVPYMLVSKRVRYTFYGEAAPEFEIVPASERLHQRLKEAPAPEVIAYRRKANRLGIFVTIASAIILLAGAVGSVGYSV